MITTAHSDLTTFRKSSQAFDKPRSLGLGEGVLLGLALSGTLAAMEIGDAQWAQGKRRSFGKKGMMS